MTGCTTARRAVGRRIETLAQLACDACQFGSNAGMRPSILLTTVNAILQRVPPKTYFTGSSLVITAGQTTKDLTNGQTLGQLRWLIILLVRLICEPIRCGKPVNLRFAAFCDVFPPGQKTPARFDFFGDDVETIRSFDPATQRTIGKLKS